MVKFKVYLSKCFTIEVVAETEEEAVEMAFDAPPEKWEDGFESEYIVEAMEELTK